MRLKANTRGGFASSFRIGSIVGAAQETIVTGSWGIGLYGPQRSLVGTRHNLNFPYCAVQFQ
jgi:hypothetical protein